MHEESSVIFEALADPTRREILRLLAHGELAATDVSNAVTWIGRTAVSSHLRILRTAGLIDERRDGKFRYYSINPAPAAGVVEFLSAVYRSSLDDLRVPRDADIGEADTPDAVSEVS